MAGKTLKFTALGVVVAGIIYLPGFLKIQQLKSRERELGERIIQLKKQNAVLENEKMKLEKDMTYLEKVAREKLGMTKKGEIVYRVVPHKE